ncbi:MAG: GNAT family N-acetyltransferase [Armatimonadetes bacterium]|nr:GNAT family N-acetyltransferase [Armatimonadota bacterium]
MGDQAEVRIRRFCSGDLERVCEIIGQHSQWDKRAAERSLRVALQLEALNVMDVGHVVAEVGGRVVGVSGWFESPIAAEGVYWLSWTYVDRDHRRRGIGSRLLAYVISHVREQGARRLYLDTGVRGYDQAIAFYEQHGFRKQAVLEDFYAPGAHCVLMALDI